MSEKIENQYTLAEIRKIAERVAYILGGPFAGQYFSGVKMKFHHAYLLKSWAQPFLTKGEAVVQQQDKIILSFCKEGERSVPMDKMSEYMTTVNEYLNTKDTVETVGKIKLEWLKDLELEDCSVLYSLIEE